jgi:hypothetical protein
LTPNLVEVDVGEKLAVGFRNTRLGIRDTNEIFFRLQKSKESSALDPRDNRKGGVKNPLSALGSMHLGLVGVETDGSRGKAYSLRAGLYGLKRAQDGLFTVTEFAYQSGTFGGDLNLKQNKGGLFSRIGVRKTLSNSAYAETDYSFSPGIERRGIPRLRVGMSF